MNFNRNVDFAKVIIHVSMISICLSYIRTVMAQCDEYMWTCDEGSCIEVHEQCDGSVQCPDGSDETAVNCMSNPCSDFAFRCAYGGCITGTHRCNNMTDCRDNSDELFCDNSPAVNIQGNCSSKWQMQCFVTRECIDIQFTCNGIADCLDSSDETVELCGKRECSVGFQCAYGGCVKEDARCNGKKDCHDGSDEAWEMCGYARPPPKAITTTTSTTTTSTTTTTTSTSTTTAQPDIDYSDEDEEGLPCRLPANLKRTVVRFANTNDTVPRETLINDGEQVFVTCRGSANRGFPMCLNGTWNQAFPHCPAFCDIAEIRGISTDYRCLVNSTLANTRCRSSGVYGNTYIDLVCAPRYEKHFFGSQMMKCLDDGSYEFPRVRCNHTCGRLDGPVHPLMRHGLRTEPTKVPWHVAIYSNYSGINEYICGGSIISPRHIISAAHCFVNESRIVPSHYFHIIAGRSHILDETVRGEMPQIRYLADIHISRQYSMHWPLWADISLIKLTEPLLYTSQISAICMFPPLKYPDGVTPSGTPGIVAGYGINSKRLEVLSLNTIDHESCLRLNGDDTLGPDKFCLHNVYVDSTLCRGDSGGAFVQTIGSVNYLLGVVSYTPTIQNDCSSSKVLAISTARHIEDDLWEKVQKGKRSDRALF